MSTSMTRGMDHESRRIDSMELRPKDVCGPIALRKTQRMTLLGIGVRRNPTRSTPEQALDGQYTTGNRDRMSVASPLVLGYNHLSAMLLLTCISLRFLLPQR